MADEPREPDEKKKSNGKKPIDQVRDELAAAPVVTLVVDNTPAKEPKKPRGGGKRKPSGHELVLESPEPWPAAVDGAKLLDDIAGAISAYVVLPPHAADTDALFCAHSHALDAANHSPRLVKKSAAKRCGKTTALRAIGKIAPRALRMENISPAAIFRTVEKAHPTLFIDEADTCVKGSEEIRGLLNSGHDRDGQVVRLEKTGRDGDGGYEPRAYSTFAATALACIGDLQPTIMDRAIVIRMYRRRGNEPIRRFRSDRCDDLRVLARKAARWASDHMDELAAADPEMPEELHDRAADNWRPLVAIADAAGGDWPARARAAALAISGVPSDNDEAAIMLLRDLYPVINAMEGEHITSQQLASALHAMVDRPWPAWGKQGKPITPHKVASLLADFGIYSWDVRIDDKVVKAYAITAFLDAFERYL